MPRAASFSVQARAESIKKLIKDQLEQPKQRWRIQGHSGLVLITHPTGIASWWFFYRLPNDKQRKIRIGDTTNTTLAVACQKALEHRADVGRGINPQLSRHKGMTFKELAERCLVEHPSLSASTRSNYRYYLVASVYPQIGHKPASAVTVDDVAAICRSIKARKKIVQSQRVKTTIGGIFAWGMRETLVSTNPARGVPNQQTVKSVRDRLPTDVEIRTIWHAVDTLPRMSKAVRLIIKLAIVTGLRRKEIAGARLDELAGDTWTIRGDIAKAGRIVDEGRMKSGREQIVYLSRQARALFDEAIAGCADDTYVFAADPLETAAKKPKFGHVSPDAVTRAVKRICNAYGIEDLHLHDMRTAITSQLDDDDVQETIQSAVLHHTPQDVTSVHYRRSKRERRMRAAWQLWADHLDRILVAGPPLPKAPRKPGAHPVGRPRKRIHAGTSALDAGS